MKEGEEKVDMHQIYESLLGPAYWFDTAERLQVSGERLFSVLSEVRKDKSPGRNNEKLALMSSCMMLLGFSLENAAKGYAIKSYQLKNNGEQAANFKDIKKKAWGNSKGHDIEAILDYCEFDLTEEERNLLRRLQHFAIYLGRYPVPQSIKHYIKGKDEELDRMKAIDKATFKSLYQRLVGNGPFIRIPDLDERLE